MDYTLNYDSKKVQRKKKLNPKPRLYYIDNLRVFACFLVLLTHSAMPAKNPITEGFWLFSLSFIGSPSSELFLALSGTVLLPVNSGMKNFYKKRFTKLIPPVIFWSIVGMFSYIPLKGYSLHESLMSIAFIPLKPVIGVYWFIYVMVGLYLFAPIISAFLKTSTKRQLEFFILLWAVTLFMPWLYGILEGNFDQNGSHYWMLNYFGGFLGYWVLGFFLSKYPVKISWNPRWIFLLLLTLIYPLSILIMKLRDINVSPYMDNLQLGSAVLVALLYTIFQNIKLPSNFQAFLTSIAKFSFGIYLIHYYTRDFFWKIFDNSSIPTFPRTFMIAALMMGICWCIVWIVSKLPYGKYLTGT